MEAYLSVNGMVEVFDEKFKDQLPATERSPVDADEQKAKTKNALAMAILVSSFKRKGLMNKIHDAKTADWPTGLAYKVHAALIKEYRPVDFTAKVELKAKFQGLKMQKKENTLKLKEKIGSLKHNF